MAAGLIALAATAAYANSFRGSFQFDDIPAILENPTVRHLWPLGIPLRPPPGALTVSGRPFLNLSLAFNYAVSGYDPWSYHALNLLIHIGSALVLFGIVRRTLGRLAIPGAWASGLAVALLWVVHPVTTESVTYIVQRAESLMAFLYLATLYCFVRSADTPSAARRILWRAMAVVACLLGMATKEVMVTVPVVVFLYDRTFVAKSWKGAWRAGWGFYLSLVATWALLVWLVAGTGWDRGGTSGFHVGVSWVGYWMTQGEAMVRYAGLAVWPHPLAFDYGPASAPPALAYLLTTLVAAAFAATAVGCYRGRPWAFLAGTCFLILSPTSVMPGVLQFAAEHRIYLPLAAAVATVVIEVRSAAPRWIPSETPRRRVLVLALAAVVACLGTATALRNTYYVDALTMWRDTVTKRPQSAVAEANMGMALINSGRLAEGVVYCQESVRLDPMKPAPRYNLGLAYEEEKRWREALIQFEAAANLNPKMFAAEFRAGRLLDRLGQPVAAERYLRIALKLAPGLAPVHGSLGVALDLEGRHAEAVGEFEQSLALDPDQPEVEFDLGIDLARMGRVEEAVAHYSTAVRLKPEYGDAQLNLGVSLAQLGRLPDALPALQAAARLLPGSATAHEDLATDLDQLGRTEDAVAEYRSAIRLMPGRAETHYNFGNALIHLRDLAGARAEFAEALRLDPHLEPAREMLERLAAVPGLQ